MISSVSSRLFQPYTCATSGPIRNEEPEAFPFLKLPDIPSRQYADLRNHPDFQTIKAQFLKDVDEIDKLARRFVGSAYTAAIATFRKHIEEPPETFEAGMFPIYEETRHQIHNIVARMKPLCSGESAHPADSTAERDRITLALHVCLNEIDHCPAGVQSRFSRAWQSLEAKPEQLDALLFLTRKTLLEEFCHTFLRQAMRDKMMNIQQGDEIHWVNALFNAVCHQFGLNTISDPMATRRIRTDILNQFRSELPQVLNEYTVLHTLAYDYYQRFCNFLAKNNLSHWRTEKIPSGKLTSNYIDDLEQTIVTPLNQLCDVQEKEKAISLRTLIEPDGDGYSFARCQEKIKGWLTRTIMQAPATLFTRISFPPDRSQRCIGTYNNLFFWIFESDCPLQSPLPDSAVCPFDTEGTRALTISDLATIDVCSWPEPVQLALLNQAMEQTGLTTEDASGMAVFLLGKGSGKALRKYPDNVQNAVASQLTGKMAASQTFADELAVRFCESFRGAIPRWVMKTPLLEQLLVVQWISGEEVGTTIDNLSIWQLMTFSPFSLKTLLTPDKCQNLFQSALDQEWGGFMWRLLQTGHCDTMNNHVSPKIQSVLMELCRQGITDGVAYLVSTLPNTDVNSKNANGNTALHFAAFYGHIACLNELLARDDITVNEKNITGWTALHIAAHHGHAESLGKLLARDDIAINERKNDRWTALHIAAQHGHTECLDKLLARDDIAINEKNIDGWTALHIAAQHGHTECLDKLLARADIAINEKNNNGWTALHIAAQHGSTEYLSKLLAKNNIDLNSQSNQGWTALHLAARYNHTECLEKLLAMDRIDLNAKSNEGFTALHYAAGNNYTTCLDKLLAMDRIDLNAKSNEGFTALHYAAGNNYTTSLEKLLAMDRIAVNAKDNHDYTALHYTAIRGYTASLQLLLQNKLIRVNAVNTQGLTPLMGATIAGQIRSVELLLSHGDTDPGVTDSSGLDACMFARIKQYLEIVIMLENDPRYNR